MATPSIGAEERVLIIGASRGLGLALAQTYLRRGAKVVATVRQGPRTKLHHLLEGAKGRLEIEHVDINVPEQISALRTRLHGRTFDILFLNAGVANGRDETIGEVSTDEFVRLMVTNALSPLRAIEALQDLVPAMGTIAVMSSGQGSVTNNTKGGAEVYRASKAALNTLMRSFAARHAGESRTLLLLAPGWIKTDLGGAGAPFTADENIPKVVATIGAQRGKPGLQYLDYNGQSVPW